MDRKDHYSIAFLKAGQESSIEEQLKKVKPFWWYNLREKNKGGLRLTDEALSYIIEKADLKTYEISIPKDVKITSQVLIWLDHFITTPWHLKKHTITVISEKTAFELYLFSGDIRKLGQNKAMAVRLEKSEIVKDKLSVNKYPSNE